MRPAEKGDQQECIGSFSRWVLHQDPRARRHVGAADPPPDHARPAARVQVAEAIIEDHARGKAFVADTGYDSNAIRKAVRRKRMKAVTCPNPSRNRRPRFDKGTYGYRYLVEVFFHHVKRFRALATRYEKTARNYLALLHLAATMVWLRDVELPPC